MAAPAFPILGLSVYVWIAIISLVFVVLLAAFGGYGLGGDVDVDTDLDYGEFAGPGISPLSPPLVAAFGATFGSVGALLELEGLSPFLVAFLAALSGVIISVGLFFGIQKFLVRAQASSDVNPQALVGRDAQVMIPLRTGAQGQILIITEERGRTLFPAVAGEDIGRDSIVEIVGFAGGVANVRKKTG